jgi:hypothetical protein
VALLSHRCNFYALVAQLFLSLPLMFITVWCTLWLHFAERSSSVLARETVWRALLEGGQGECAAPSAVSPAGEVGWAAAMFAARL